MLRYGLAWTAWYSLSVSVDIAVEVVPGDPNDLAEAMNPEFADGDHSAHMLARDAELFGDVVDGEEALGLGGRGGVSHVLSAPRVLRRPCVRERVRAGGRL